MFVLRFLSTEFPPFKEHKIQGLFQDFEGPSYAYLTTECAKNIRFKINACFIMLLIRPQLPRNF